MTEEERQRIEKSGMGVGKGGLNTGEEQLFGASRAHPTAAATRSSLTLFLSYSHSQEAHQGGEEGRGGGETRGARREEGADRGDEGGDRLEPAG